MEEHQYRSGNVAVDAAQRAWHLRERAGRADAQGCMLLMIEDAAIASRQLSDVELPPGASIGKGDVFVFLHALDARKDRMSLATLERPFGGERIEGVPGLVTILAPGERRLPSSGVPPRAVVHRRGRNAILVDRGLELLGAVEAAVARLQRPAIRGIDRHAERVRVELGRLDVPAI